MTRAILAQVELRLAIKPEATTAGRAEPLRTGKSIELLTRGQARVEMHPHHLLAVDPARVGRDHRSMLGKACFARPEARSRIGHALAEAFFDQQVAPQQTEISGDIAAEHVEDGDDLLVDTERVVAICEPRQEFGAAGAEEPDDRVVPRGFAIAAQDLGIRAGTVVEDRY